MAITKQAQLTKKQVELLREPFVAVVTTLREDGSPHTTPVWIDTDGEHVLFNTAVGRAKERYVREDARVSVLVLDPEDPYRWVSVSGRAELDEDQDHAVAHIDRLAQKYTGRAEYGVGPEERRIIVRITPERIDSRGL